MAPEALEDLTERGGRRPDPLEAGGCPENSDCPWRAVRLLVGQIGAHGKSRPKVGGKVDGKRSTETVDGNGRRK
jgi:hypothetical protein